MGYTRAGWQFPSSMEIVTPSRMTNFPCYFLCCPKKKNEINKIKSKYSFLFYVQFSMQLILIDSRVEFGDDNKKLIWVRREIGENVNSFVVMLDGFHVHCQLQQNFMVPAACCMLCVACCGACCMLFCYLLVFTCYLEEALKTTASIKVEKCIVRQSIMQHYFIESDW